jgi:hypothetical protein
MLRSRHRPPCFAVNLNLRPNPTKKKLRLKVRPLTPELWPALEDLFGDKGACNGC